jgi:hypothetical protein
MAHLTGNVVLFERLAQEPHWKFSVLKQKDGDFWEDPSHTGTRLRQVIGLSKWRAEAAAASFFTQITSISLLWRCTQS